MAESGDSRVLRTIPLLIACCVFISGCFEFKSIKQPSSILPGQTSIVLVQVEVYADSSHSVQPYSGICLPDGWIIMDDAIPYKGVYEGTIVYNIDLAIEQENLSPAPDGYYWWVGSGNWWVGDGNEVDMIQGTAYSEIQIKTNEQTGLFSIDYMLGDSFFGLNYKRSNNHLIDVVDEYTPRELRAFVQEDSIILTWTAPAMTEGLVGYNVYRDGHWIKTGPAENTEYIDKNLAGGVFYYSASAIYADGDEHLTPYEIKGLMFSGGTGEPNNPYQIATAEQIISIADFPYMLDNHFLLTNNINLDPNLVGGRILDKALIPTFFRTFDGNNHMLSHLTIKSKGAMGLLGMFGELKPGAKIKDLAVVDVNIIGSENYIGGLVGLNYGDLTSCYVTGTVTGIDYVGGLVGWNSGSITTSYSSGTVTGDRTVGGLVGYSNEGSIITSYSTSTVSGNVDVGGLVGANDNGSIAGSYSTGTVSGNTAVGGFAGTNGDDVIQCYSTGTVNGDRYVGGLVGGNWASITASYSSGSISGVEYVGGLAGHNWNGGITTSYSTGTVNGDRYVGGLVGSNWKGNIATSYSTCTVNGEIRVGGLVGIDYHGSDDSGSITASFWDMETSGQTWSYGGTGMATVDLKTASTFLEAGWDFVDETENGTEDIWWIDEGQDYPKLWWEISD